MVRATTRPRGGGGRPPRSRPSTGGVARDGGRGGLVRGTSRPVSAVSAAARGAGRGALRRGREHVDVVPLWRRAAVDHGAAALVERVLRRDAGRGLHRR